MKRQLMTREKPSGVVFLVILEILSGVFELSVSVLLFISPNLLSGFAPGIDSFLAGIILFVGIVFLITGLIDFGVAYGLWTSQEWAWTFSLDFSMLGIILSVLLFPGGTIGLIAGILRVYWLTRSKVEEFFGVKGEWGARMADLKHTLYLLRRNPLVIAGTIIALLFILMGLLANFIVDPILATPGGYPGQTYPFERKYMWSADNIINWGSGIALYHGPDFFWLGTDSYGRDLLKMIILAIPVDLYNATIIVTIAAVFGTFLGAVAGYVGGVFDEALLRITDVFFAFPGLVLALVFAALLGRSIETLQLAIVLVWWPPYVRLMRGQVLSEKEKPYVEALRALGASHSRILFRHVILNSIFPIIVQATMDFGGVILTFSALMFLGFSPSPAMPELGNLAADGYGHIFDAPWVMLFPGLTMLIISLAFNLVGDGLRDVLDPRLRR